ncbi:WhiB family transcriptional regulator [Kitasatospora sp. NPDC054939]
MNRGEARLPCQDDPDLFFPISYTGFGLVQVEEAKGVCKGCPIKAACLEDILQHEGSKSARDRSGVWGGTTPGERHKIYRGRADRFTEAA